MTINEKLTKIQVEFKSKKSRFNSFGKYYFRSAEDILEATKPFLKELGVTVTINEQFLLGGDDNPVLQVTATISDGENKLSATAIVGVDMQQKGMQVPQKYGAASSYGKKYALGNLFLIDDTQDSDATNSHGKDAATKKPVKKKQLFKKDPAFDKAVEYIKSGGALDAIKQKYDLTKEAEKELSTL
jgi:hypothetical protein